MHDRLFMTTLTLTCLSDVFNIHRFAHGVNIPKQVFEQSHYFIAKTSDELSIVVPQSCKLSSTSIEENWRALKVLGPLDFSLTGILAKISAVLADEKISIFAISTFDTDYILVKQTQLSTAISALEQHNYQIS